MKKLYWREEVHIIHAEVTKEAWEKFVADDEAKRASAPAAANPGAALLGKLGGGAGGGPNPLSQLKLKMEFTLKQKVK